VFKFVVSLAVANIMSPGLFFQKDKWKYNENCSVVYCAMLCIFIFFGPVGVGIDRLFCLVHIFLNHSQFVLLLFFICFFSHLFFQVLWRGVRKQSDEIGFKL